MPMVDGRRRSTGARSGARFGRTLALLALASTSCSRSFIGPVESLGLLDPSQPRTPPSVHITAAGVSPSQVHVDHPITVIFTNDDRSAHHLEAAPELGYGACPEMASLGTLEPGQSGTVTIERGGVICAFHDAAGPANAAFQGFLVVH